MNEELEKLLYTEFTDEEINKISDLNPTLFRKFQRNIREQQDRSIYDNFNFFKAKKEIDVDALRSAGYSMVALYQNHEIVMFNEYGSYQGAWAILSYYKQRYYIWTGYYGSCSGCDDLQASDPRTEEEIRNFCETYHYFVDFDLDKSLSIDEFQTFCPRNSFDSFYDEDDYLTVVRDIYESWQKHEDPMCKL